MNTSVYQRIRIAVLTLSTILFPVTFFYLSPAVSLYGSSLGIITGSLIVFMLQFLTAMIFGRAFCSWGCPGGGIQDQVGQARNRRISLRRIAWLKYIVWGVWIGTLALFFRRAGGVKGVEFAFSTEKGLSTTSVEAIISYAVVVLVFFVLSLTLGRRAGCHTLCWMAPFMVLGRRIGLALRTPSLRLATTPQSCVSCGRCREQCPMSLDVERLAQRGSITDDNCILCGRCVDNCGSNTIRIAWRKAS